MGWEKIRLSQVFEFFFLARISKKAFFTWLTTFGRSEGKLSRSNIVYIRKIR